MLVFFDDILVGQSEKTIKDIRSFEAHLSLTHCGTSQCVRDPAYMPTPYTSSLGRNGKKGGIGKYRVCLGSVYFAKVKNFC